MTDLKKMMGNINKFADSIPEECKKPKPDNEQKTITIFGCSQCGDDHKDITITKEPRKGFHEGAWWHAWWHAFCPKTKGGVDVEFIVLSSIVPIQEHEGTFKFTDTFRTGRIWPKDDQTYPYDVEIECQLCGENRKYRNKTLEDAKQRLKSATPQASVCEQCLVKSIIANAHLLSLEPLADELKEEWGQWL